MKERSGLKKRKEAWGPRSAASKMAPDGPGLLAFTPSYNPLPYQLASVKWNMVKVWDITSMTKGQKVVTPILLTRSLSPLTFVLRLSASSHSHVPCHVVSCKIERPIGQGSKDGVWLTAPVERSRVNNHLRKLGRGSFPSQALRGDHSSG